MVFDARSASAPPPLTGGGGRPWRERTFPEAPLTDSGDDYAVQVAHGWDSLQEAYNLALPFKLEQELERAKEKAQQMDDQGRGVVTVDVAGEPFQVASHGAKGGKRFVIGNSDVLLMIGSSKSEWQISVRYIAAGLWEHGADQLRLYVFDLMMRAGFIRCDPKMVEVSRISRADYAFDYHCPAFTAEMTASMRGNIVAHSSVKVQEHGTTDALQTLTLGAINSLQVQVYDKTTEIREASGKEWMREMWSRDTGLICDGDVWRIEVRMAKEWLRERRIRTFDQLMAAKADLIAEALYTRRLVVSEGHSNKRRRAVHPLWSRAIYEADGKAMIPLGRTTTLKREQLQEVHLRNIAGTVRALQVLHSGDLDLEETGDYLDAVQSALRSDGTNAVKVPKLKERYSPQFFDEAK